MNPTPPPAVAKSTCKHCGNHIEHPADYLGNLIECPHCKHETLLLADPGGKSGEVNTVRSACQICNKTIRHPYNMVGEFTFCPHCLGRTRLSLAAYNNDEGRKWDDPVKQSSPSPAVPSVLKNQDLRLLYLENVRQRSCYPELRTFIELIFILLCLSVASPFPYFAYLSINDTKVDLTAPVLIAAVGMAVGILLSIVLRQALLLLVDMADLLIERHSRKE